jgi:hypothetical protein
MIPSLHTSPIAMLVKTGVLAAAVSFVSVAQAQKQYNIEPDSVPQAQRGKSIMLPFGCKAWKLTRTS